MRNIPTVTKNLLIINIILFLIGIWLEKYGIKFNDIFGLHFFLAKDFHLWQFITYLFMHSNFTHILINMFMLWMFGMVMENVLGKKRFLIFYLVCGIGAGICQELEQLVSYVIQDLNSDTFAIIENGVKLSTEDYINNWNTVGASGAIYGVLLAYGMTFPNQKMFIIPIPIPIKAKWIITFSIAVEFFYGITSPGDGIAHIAHLGGMLFGFILIKYWQKHPYSNTYFNYHKKDNIFQHLKNKFNTNTYKPNHNNPKTESDWEYNARKKEAQEEIDSILDKIRKNGYDSLTKEEKLKLFNSNK